MSAIDIIDVKLTTTNFLTRWPCHVCGGCTEKQTVLAEATDENGGGVLRVCEQCLKAGDIDQRLGAHADALEAEAANVRALVGRINAPSYAEWEAMSERVDAASYAAWCIGSAKRDFHPDLDAEAISS